MKFVIILFVLGVGITFGKTIPETENAVPEASTVLEIVAYTSELENGKGTDGVLKAAVQENINEGNILVQELQTEKSSETIENERIIIDVDVVENEALGNENLPINDFNWDGYHNFDNDYVPMQESDFNYKDLMDSDPNEIMETAAGFVPIPILKRRRQKPQRQFANRRYFRRPYPYRRFYYYPYYRYYYPGSLRFY